MRRQLFTLAIEITYAAAAAYWGWRLLAEYEPLRNALHELQARVHEQARYRAAVQRTLVAIRRLPEVPPDGPVHASGGPIPPQAGS